MDPSSKYNKYFTIVNDNRVCCRICKRTYTYGKGRATTALKNHLTHSHKIASSPSNNFMNNNQNNTNNWNLDNNQHHYNNTDYNQNNNNNNNNNNFRNNNGNLNHYNNNYINGNSQVNDFLQFIEATLVPVPNIDFQGLYNEIKKLQTFKEFNEFHKSSYTLMKVREYIISITKSLSGENLQNFYQTWAQSLHINDTTARFINDCRRVWLYFGYSLVNKCCGVEEEELQIRTRFKREISLMLTHCLPLDRANALYNIRIPWFQEKDRQYCSNPVHEPSINKRIVYLINLLEINEHAISEFLLPQSSPYIAE